MGQTDMLTVPPLVGSFWRRQGHVPADAFVDEHLFGGPTPADDPSESPATAGASSRPNLTALQAQERARQRMDREMRDKVALERRRLAALGGGGGGGAGAVGGGQGTTEEVLDTSEMDDWFARGGGGYED